MSEHKELQVAALENGTVIDHIPTEKLFKVTELLQLNKCTDSVSIGNNFPSKKIGRKGMIKVSEHFFSDEEISRLSVICPNVHLSIIRNYQVVEKKTVDLPDTLTDVVKCANPVCITNNEPMRTVFHVVEKSCGILKCHYCNKEQRLDSIKLK